MERQQGRIAVFAGDSITEADRDEDPDGLGWGWVREIAEAVPGLTVVNRGVGGSVVADLRRRWATDVLDLNPQIVTVQIGVNDTRHRYSRNEAVEVGRFAGDLEAIVDAAAEQADAVLLMEPFLIPLDDELRRWRHEDLLAKAAAARALGRRPGVAFVELDAALTEAGRIHGMAAVAADGIHPTGLGHSVLAQAWLAAATQLGAVSLQ